MKKAPAKTEKTAAEIHAELLTLDAVRATAKAAIAEMEAARPAILLSDDDAAAERHDSALAAQRRTVERTDLRRPGIAQELAQAQARERAQAQAIARAEAEQAVAAVMAEIEAEYVEPARRIGAFMARYAAANALAEATGAVTIDDQIRFRPGDPGKHLGILSRYVCLPAAYFEQPDFWMSQ